MRRIRLLASVLGFALSCTSPSSVPDDEKNWDTWDSGAAGAARRAYEAGKYRTALRHSARLLDTNYVAQPGVVELHVQILCALDRDAEARALDAFVSYYAPVEEVAVDGEGEDASEVDQVWDRSFEKDCRALWRDLPQRKKLIRTWALPGGQSDPTPAEMGRTIQATFAIGASGKAEDIVVVAATSTSEAAEIIQLIGDATVYEGRLSKLDPAELPVEYCLFVNTKRKHGSAAGTPDFNIRGKGPGSL